MPVSFVLVYAHTITQHYTCRQRKTWKYVSILATKWKYKVFIRDSVCPHDRWICFDLILISQSAMPFFPGREHIYNRTITTQTCRKLLRTQINYKNSHINKNRLSLKVAEVKYVNRCSIPPENDFITEVKENWHLGGKDARAIMLHFTSSSSNT